MKYRNYEVVDVAAEGDCVDVTIAGAAAWSGSELRDIATLEVEARYPLLVVDSVAVLNRGERAEVRVLARV